MHWQYFPRCPVEGPILPAVPYSHLTLKGAVPQKCANCEFLFEGGCGRFFELTGHWMRLDHGPCGVDGPPGVVRRRDRSGTEFEVPAKCVSCPDLMGAAKHSGCKKDLDTWGHFFRGLDWGDWEPERLLIDLEGCQTNRRMMGAAYDDDRNEFVEEFRTRNRRKSISEAHAAYRTTRTRLRNLEKLRNN